MCNVTVKGNVTWYIIYKRGENVCGLDCVCVGGGAMYMYVGQFIGRLCHTARDTHA